MQTEVTNVTVQQIREIRVEIDKLTNTAQKGLTPSREVSLSITNLQRAKMWLGKALQAAGAANPYPQSKNAQSPVIEKQADHTEDSYLLQWEQEQVSLQVARLKDLRRLISQCLSSMEEKLDVENQYLKGFKYSFSCVNSMFALEEAGMWLGWELNRLAEFNKSKE